MNHSQVRGLRALIFGLFLSPLTAQWISYPTAGVPRTADGKPDLGAACPRTADGKPDLSGLWVMEPKPGRYAEFSRLRTHRRGVRQYWVDPQGRPAVSTLGR
jgi:hypothetical protein